MKITDEMIEKMFAKYWGSIHSHTTYESYKLYVGRATDETPFKAAISLLLPIIEKQAEAIEYYSNNEIYRRPDKDRNGMSGMSARTEFEIDDGEWHTNSRGEIDHYKYGKLARQTQKEAIEMLNKITEETK